jgi:DNA-binding NtrC family response regulator
VLDHGGQFRAFSAIHGGAAFELVFPSTSIVTARPEESRASACALEDGPLVLLVDDDEEQALSLKRVLQLSGVDAMYSATVAEALVALKSSDISAVVCDSNMPDGGARTLLSQMRESSLRRRVAVMSGDTGEGLIYQFAAYGAEAFFRKPTEASEIVAWVRGSNPIESL